MNSSHFKIPARQLLMPGPRPLDRTDEDDYVHDPRTTQWRRTEKGYTPIPSEPVSRPRRTSQQRRASTLRLLVNDVRERISRTSGPIVPADSPSSAVTLLQRRDEADIPAALPPPPPSRHVEPALPSVIVAPQTPRVSPIRSWERPRHFIEGVRHTPVVEAVASTSARTRLALALLALVTAISVFVLRLTSLDADTITVERGERTVLPATFAHSASGAAARPAPAAKTAAATPRAPKKKGPSLEDLEEAQLRAARR